MNRRLLALTLFLACVSLAIVAVSAALLAETEGAKIERTRFFSEVVQIPISPPVLVVTPTRTPRTPTPVPEPTWTPVATPTISSGTELYIDRGNRPAWSWPGIGGR